MRILVTGASGLIGKNLIREALRQGHEVHALVRHPQQFRMLAESAVFSWNHEQQPPKEAFAGVQAVIHLAGAGIADRRWSQKRKQELWDSRVVGTQNLVRSIAQLSPELRPRVLLSGSAIGYYGERGDETLTETAPAGSGFLAELCQKWEGEADQAQALGLRVVHLRTGIVLSREGGALAQMPPVILGDGRAWMSWIHIQDISRLLLFAATNEKVTGALNLCSPQPATNRELIRTLAQAKGWPVPLWSPALALKLGLGELATALLSSTRVIPTAAQKAGFDFQFPTLATALQNIFAETGPLDQKLYKDQFIPLAPEKVFNFFSRAENLEILTPTWLAFHIVKMSTPQIEKGTLIDYRLKIRGVPVKWRTQISQWQPGRSFCDEQLIGPYAKWHHEHFFESVPGGCLLRDEVTYRLPGGPLGAVALKKFVMRDVNSIFNFRQQKIHELVQQGGLS